MKKTFVAAATSAVLIASPVALTMSSASANPYAGSVPTAGQAKVPAKPVAKRKPVRVNFRIATGGNGKAAAKVFMTIRHRGTGRIWIISRNYRGGVAKWQFGRNLPRGRYVMKMEYFTPNGSVFQNGQRIVRFAKR
ncbi:hypothetical protein [Nocardioides massiliensis]|uniref:Uncharacterized protein n=1 Tax=Nocardioides massiliensis TaxID=1325935 RepID=A0ABT9NN03_9ACTN|nr:hypothetical protein [Nocardioides massiliensis]MDP9821812.1 hypothetical protein [Nocardioides massiliensis]